MKPASRSIGLWVALALSTSPLEALAQDTSPAPAANEPEPSPATPPVDEPAAPAEEAAPAAEEATPAAEEATPAAESSGPSEAAAVPAQAAAAAVEAAANAVKATVPAAQIPAAEKKSGELYFEAQGDLQIRPTMMSPIPLRPLARDVTGSTGVLGQERWLESWLGLGAELGFRRELRLIAEVDIWDGVVAGDLSQGVGRASQPRDSTVGLDEIGLRRLFVEWTSAIFQLRFGQMSSHWGLGILANDGQHDAPFGDSRHGDIVERIMLATKPLGEDSSFYLAVAADLVFQDQLADLNEGDEAMQGVLAAWYQQGRHRLGFYGVLRQQENPLGDTLQVGVFNAHAHWTQETALGLGVAAMEAAAVVGTSTLGRSTERAESVVQQLMAVAQLGIERPTLQATLELGLVSGDADGSDGVVRRATLDPDHRVGLVLFPEVLAWHSARAAELANNPELSARPSRGSAYLPTNGGVSGASYLFPHAIFRPKSWLEGRLGAVLAWSSADAVDPYRQGAYSENVGVLGGDPSKRFLGLELDGSLQVHLDLDERLRFSNGVEAGVLLPGGAFDDEAGAAMDPVWLLRIRSGVSF